LRISWTNKRFDNIKMHGATVKKILIIIMFNNNMQH